MEPKRGRNACAQFTFAFYPLCATVELYSFLNTLREKAIQSIRAERVYIRALLHFLARRQAALEAHSLNSLLVGISGSIVPRIAKPELTEYCCDCSILILKHFRVCRIYITPTESDYTSRLARTRPSIQKCVPLAQPHKRFNSEHGEHPEGEKWRRMYEPTYVSPSIV